MTTRKKPATKTEASVPGERATASAPARPLKVGPALEVPLHMIRESPTNPRRRFDESALDELAASIRAVGVLQPVLLRPNGDPPRAGKNSEATFELVCGSRRCRAAQRAGLTRIPATIRDLSDLEALHAQLVENSQRQDVSPLEEAHAFQRLLELGEPVDEMGARIGRPTRYVRTRLALLELPTDIGDLVEAGGIHLGAAVAITRLSPSLQLEVIESVRQDVQDTSWDEIREAPLTMAQVQTMVRGWERRMERAPWSLEDETLAPSEAGPCSTCPYRSISQPDLFDEKIDRCTSKPCWETRTAAHWDRVKASGARIVPAEDEDKLLLHSTRVGDVLMRPQQLADGVEGVKPALLQEADGSYLEVYYREEVAEALEAEGRTELAAAVRTPTPKELDTWKERQKQLEQERQAAEAGIDARITELVDVVNRMDLARAVTVLRHLVAATLRAVPSVTVLQSMLRRRDIADPGSAQRVTTLLADLEDLPTWEIIAVLIEVATYTELRRGTGGPTDWLDELARLTGVQVVQPRQEAAPSTGREAGTEPEPDATDAAEEGAAIGGEA